MHSFVHSTDFNLIIAANAAITAHENERGESVQYIQKSPQSG